MGKYGDHALQQACLIQNIVASWSKCVHTLPHYTKHTVTQFYMLQSANQPICLNVPV